jgi:hypothetical protein
VDYAIDYGLAVGIGLVIVEAPIFIIVVLIGMHLFWNLLEPDRQGKATPVFCLGKV